MRCTGLLCSRPAWLGKDDGGDLRNGSVYIIGTSIMELLVMMIMLILLMIMTMVVVMLRVLE